MSIISGLVLQIFLLFDIQVNNFGTSYFFGRMTLRKIYIIKETVVLHLYFCQNKGAINTFYKTKIICMHLVTDGE